MRRVRRRVRSAHLPGEDLRSELRGQSEARGRPERSAQLPLVRASVERLRAVRCVSCWDRNVAGTAEDHRCPRGQERSHRVLAGFRGSAACPPGGAARHGRHRCALGRRAVRGDVTASRVRVPGARAQSRVPVRMEREAGQGQVEGELDLLHRHLQHRRRCLSAGTQTVGAQGPPRAHLPPSGHSVHHRRAVCALRSRALRGGLQRGALVPRGSDDDPDPQLDAGTGHRPSRLDQARPRVRHLLAGDGAQRDRDAPAVRRSPCPAAEDAQGEHGRRGLDAVRPHDGFHQRGTALHRRLPEHVAHGDPVEVPAPEAAGGPETGHRRLPPAHDVRQARRIAPAGGLRVLPCPEAPREGDRGPGHRVVAAEPWSRAAHRQAADGLGPSRIGLPDGGHPGPARRHRRGDDDGGVVRPPGARRPRVGARRVAALRAAAPHPRLPHRREAGVPAAHGVRQGGAGDGEPPVPHVRRVEAAGGARHG